MQPDYLIKVGNYKYSVPYVFIGKKAYLHTTETCIEVFHHDNRITSHVRRFYSSEPFYMPEHMPENHRKFGECNPESFLDQDVGKNVEHSTLIMVKYLLSLSHPLFIILVHQRFPASPIFLFRIFYVPHLYSQ